MKVTLWGTRGSLATPGPRTDRYGGETSCVQVSVGTDSALVLDAGTGIRTLGKALPTGVRRIDIMLTHLHMDHIQGLVFFAPLFNPSIDVHIWGPRSTMLTLRERISRYVSPPLFPVHLRDVAPQLHIHEIPGRVFMVGDVGVTAELVCHPNPTLGYRLEHGGHSMAYLPDHEPALGLQHGYLSSDWTSGFGLASNVDLLIHDAQYSEAEYDAHVGWGHSSMEQAFAFANLARVSSLVPFHHDPSHSDEDLDTMLDVAEDRVPPEFTVIRGIQATTIDLGETGPRVTQ